MVASSAGWTGAQDPFPAWPLEVGRVLDDLELLKKVAMPA
jgi:hypothetical protein